MHIKVSATSHIIYYYTSVCLLYKTRVYTIKYITFPNRQKPAKKDPVVGLIEVFDVSNDGARRGNRGVYNIIAHKRGFFFYVFYILHKNHPYNPASPFAPSPHLTAAVDRSNDYYYFYCHRCRRMLRVRINTRVYRHNTQ